MSIDVRKGMPPRKLDHQTFRDRFKLPFKDPVFAPLQQTLDAVAEAAWDAYANSRKSPLTRPAGIGFHDPGYEIAVDWLEARAAIEEARRVFEDENADPNILIVNGSSRTEHTCPGEMSKSWRMAELARETMATQGSFNVEILDLSRATSEFGRTIHPCKSCVSTSMALCHWPCSCYPNYSLGQVHDWMNEIYPLWVRAHGVMIITPVNWYQVPTTLKAMIDRLVCADGGNPDPSSTHGKQAEEAKALELAGWPYPKHLAGRYFAAVVHGDAVGAEAVRRALIDWASDMAMIPAGSKAEVDGYIGYYEPYATSHQSYDEDLPFQAEISNAAITLCEAISAKRAGKLTNAGERLKDPRPK